MTPTRVRSLAGLAAAAVLLTGCSSVPAFNPGVAARVADATITSNDVEETAASYCSAVETQLQEGQAVPNSVVSAQVAGALTLQEAGEQFAAAQGVEPDPSYQDAEDSLEQSIATLTPEQQDAVRRVNLARPYVAAVELAVGIEEVGDEDPEAAAAAGHEAFASWLDDQDVRIDPRYPVAIEDGAIARSDTSISFAVSDVAQAGQAAEPDQAAAAALPDSQRCG
ncbi:hypothetical protein [Nocardioides sp. SR21]|uniref:hypothetical protein n=1 Tax=Nocardioides sp. SR21 TaxID=2919501 RepID=UPI001FA9B61A|nr:hypothetical protein [Nocardioides sp. SR21]